MNPATKLLLIASFLVAGKIDAQTDDKTPIAILPFIQPTGASVLNLSAVQECVSKEFIERDRFEIVDRSKMEAVMKELNIQKSEEFLNSNIVDQGKLAGAQFLVTGVVSEMRINSISSQGVSATGALVTRWKYQGIINLSYQVIDVATGTAVYSENISVSSRQFDNQNVGNIEANALCYLKKSIRKAVMKQFPEEIQILSVEKTDKKGLPQILLISSGERMFSEESDRHSSCEEGTVAGTLGKIDIFKKKERTYLAVYEVNVITVNGKDIKRQKEIGKLELADVQGDVATCEVKDGAKAIQDNMSGGKKMLVKIKE